MTVTWENVAAAAAPQGLAVLGALHPGLGDGAPEEVGSLFLLGPDGPGFWEVFSAAPEARDRRPNPMNRWSERVIGTIAQGFGGVALFPFGGPPWRPFTGWARASGHAWPSPVNLLVHDRAGLFVSYRGAIGLPGRLALPPAGQRPCDGCPAPCRSACPPAALTARGYDVPACHRWLDRREGQDCLDRGCRVRRACPVGADLRPAAQSAFHMTAFHGRQGPCTD